MKHETNLPRFLLMILAWSALFSLMLAGYGFAYDDETNFLEELIGAAVVVGVITPFLFFTAWVVERIQGLGASRSFARNVVTVLSVALPITLISFLLDLSTEPEFIREILEDEDQPHLLLLSDLIETFLDATILLTVHWTVLVNLESLSARKGRQSPSDAQPRSPDPSPNSELLLESGTVDGAAAAVPLCARFPQLKDCEIWAIEAQEHYIKVHTDRDDHLLLYRFGHAVDDAAPLDGMQVHRSFWIARNAVSGHRKEGRRVLLTLKNGLEIPVSQSYRQAVRSAGLLHEG